MVNDLDVVQIGLPVADTAIFFKKKLSKINYYFQCGLKLDFKFMQNTKANIQDFILFIV